MSDTSRPAIGPNPLPSELLKGIVGGAQHDDKQTVDSNTAIAMTAGADGAGHDAGGQAMNPAGQPPAAAQTVDDVGKLADQLQEQASSKPNEIPKGITDQQQHHQQEPDPFRTVLEAQQPAQTAHEAQHDFSEQAKTVLQYVATTAAHPDFQNDPDAIEKAMATCRQAVESGDPDAFKAALADVFGQPAAGEGGIANESGIDGGEQARESQQQSAEAISTPDPKLPSDEIADQINRSVSVDQAAELAAKSGSHKLFAESLVKNLGKISSNIGHLFAAEQFAAAHVNAKTASDQATMNAQAKDASSASVDEIADQINRSVGVDQAAELSSSFRDNENEKRFTFGEFVDALWEITRSDVALLSRLSDLSTKRLAPAYVNAKTGSSE